MEIISTSPNILNLSHLTHSYDVCVYRIGFIPNGGRIYYSKRSQPPLLIPMFDSYYEATRDVEFIRKNIDVLEKEYNFWIANRTVAVQMPGSEDVYRLARYDVALGKPRPEGYMEDLEMAHQLGLNDSKSDDSSSFKVQAS